MPVRTASSSTVRTSVLAISGLRQRVVGRQRQGGFPVYFGLGPIPATRMMRQRSLPEWAEASGGSGRGSMSETRAFHRFTETANRSIPLFLRNSGRKTDHTFPGIALERDRPKGWPPLLSLPQ
jgi:hypothetical protein